MVGRLLGERQLEPRVGVEVRVGDVVHDLAHRPAALAVRRVELGIAQSATAARIFAGAAAMSSMSDWRSERGDGRLRIESADGIAGIGLHSGIVAQKQCLELSACA